MSCRVERIALPFVLPGSLSSNHLGPILQPTKAGKTREAPRNEIITYISYPDKSFRHTQAVAPGEGSGNCLMTSRLATVDYDHLLRSQLEALAGTCKREFLYDSLPFFSSNAV